MRVRSRAVVWLATTVAVAVATSVTLKRLTAGHIFRFAFHFGLFQALMPVLGWLAGTTIAKWVASWDHWIAFGLLAFVGGRAIVEGLRGGTGFADQQRDPTRGWSLVVLSVATSIDAFAVGLSLAWLGLTGIALVWLLGIDALTPPASTTTLLAATGLLIMVLGLWAFATQRHLLRRLLAFNLLGSGIFLLLTGLAGPVAEVRGLILVGLVVALLGSVLGAVLLLRLHAQAGQVTLNAVFSVSSGSGT